jgi:hypothetical protein
MAYIKLERKKNQRVKTEKYSIAYLSLFSRYFETTPSNGNTINKAVNLSKQSIAVLSKIFFISLQI